MRTTVDIDLRLLKQLRDGAHRHGVPFKEYLNGVLRRGLSERPAAAPTRYDCPTFALGEPLRAIDKALALADTLQDEETARELTLRK